MWSGPPQSKGQWKTSFGYLLRLKRSKMVRKRGEYRRDYSFRFKNPSTTLGSKCFPACSWICFRAFSSGHWEDLLRWHDQTFRSVLAVGGGEEIDHAGDGFYLARFCRPNHLGFSH